MANAATATAHHDLVARAITWLDEHAQDRPDLGALAAEVGMSPGHVQRVFTRWAGVSPTQFLQYRTAESAAAMLAADAPVLDATAGAGLSSSGRLHDVMVTVHAVTPGEARRRGEGLTVRWGHAPTPFGQALVGTTERGVCHLAFVDDGDGLDDLRGRWPGATLVEDHEVADDVVGRVFDPRVGDAPLAVLVSGTNLQVQVWQALLRIPEGRAVSYGQVADAIGRPDATRAVAGAVAANRLAVLVPCHRVLRSTGALSGYRWGVERKRRLLAVEGARSSSDARRRRAS